MRAIWAIARREADAYFSTPLGWICLAIFLFVNGLFFALMVGEYSMQSVQAAFNPYGAPMNLDEWVVAPFFMNAAVILLLLSPALSMRLFAEDRRQRSLELLLSSPVSSTEIVLGKYLGVLLFVGVLLASTAHFPVVLLWIGNPDPGILAASYVAVFLMAATFLAVGMLMSAFTENQVVALFTSFGLLLMLWVLTWAEGFTDATWGAVVAQVSMLSHLEDLTKGLLRVSDLVYYASFIGFFLFATHQRLEAQRWQ